MLKAVSTLSLLALLSALQSSTTGRAAVSVVERHDPRIYDFSIEVAVRTDLSPQVRHRTNILRIEYNLKDAYLVMPVILNGPFSAVDEDTMGASLWIHDREVSYVQRETRVEDGQPFNTHRIRIPIKQLEAHRFRWATQFRTQVWSSRINDAMAAEIDWPTQWPEHVRDGLQPQRYIESDDQRFAETVERISGGRTQLRSVPPYYAAKEIIRFVLQNVQVEGTGIHRGNFGVLTGININGARQAATVGRGTNHDLVAVCVAMLRAADIPARPVVGLHRRRRPDGSRKGAHEFISWGEFYLPGAGWIPFDPVSMRGKGLHRRVDEPWPELGTMDDLNTRIPLAYHFTPVGVTQAPEYPAIWGWNPRGSGPTPASKQEIRLSMAYQGKGTQ